MDAFEEVEVEDRRTVKKIMERIEKKKKQQNDQRMVLNTVFFYNQISLKITHPIIPSPCNHAHTLTGIHNSNNNKFSATVQTGTLRA